MEDFLLLVSYVHFFMEYIWRCFQTSAESASLFATVAPGTIPMARLLPTNVWPASRLAVQTHQSSRCEPTCRTSPQSHTSACSSIRCHHSPGVVTAQRRAKLVG